MAYNMTGVEASTNIFGMMQEIDALASNILSIGFIIGLFTISLILLLRRSPPAESFFASSLLAVMASLGFWFAGWVPIFWVVGFGMLFGFSAVGLFMSNKT